MTNTIQPEMTIEDARRVMWLRSNRRPLGELLDEGYLTRPRLEWAAENAYNDNLKQAAQVLLSSKVAAPPLPKPAPGIAMEVHSTSEPEQAVPIGITMDQARATEWPYRPYRGERMGELVESLAISLKDLGFAIENAWEKKVRNAAIALMLVRLDQQVMEPEQASGPLQVISGGRSYSERKQYSLTLAQGGVLGFLLGFSVLLFIQMTTRQSSSGPSRSISYYLASPTGILALIIAIALFIGVPWLFLSLVNRFVDSLDRQIENYREGQEGEDRVEIALRQALDGSWTLFRDVSLPGRKESDIDGILVGPPGVWALEIKNWSGEHRNIGDTWEYRSGSRWKAKRDNPGEQANRNAIALKNFLAADGIRMWINAAVVWANPDSSLTVENPSVAVWTLDRLPDEVGNVWVDDVLPEATGDRIVKKLKLKCERQEEAQRTQSEQGGR